MWNAFELADNMQAYSELIERRAWMNGRGKPTPTVELSDGGKRAAKVLAKEIQVTIDMGVELIAEGEKRNGNR